MGIAVPDEFKYDNAAAMFIDGGSSHSDNG